MDIKQRRLLDKIKKLHSKLLYSMNLNDNKYFDLLSKYKDYHNTMNLEILQLELAKKKATQL